MHVCECLTSFMWLNSTSYALTEVIHADTLTLPGVSSMSDKGQTDSHRAQVHAARRAAETADPLSPSSTEKRDSDSQSETWWYSYNTFYTVNIQPVMPTANKFIYFWVTMWVYCIENKFCPAFCRALPILTWSKQKFKSFMVSKTKPGVLSGSMFSIFLKAEGKHLQNKVIWCIEHVFLFFF